MSTQKPIADNLFTWPSDSPKLIGSKDTETGRYFFPAKNSNHHEKVELSNKELAKRKKKWKPKKIEYTSGTLWKYSQSVGPAFQGAVTHPAASKEKK